MLQASGIEVWTAGDDGMTQRFADAYRAKIADMCSDDRCRGIKATVHQARPLHGNEVEFAVEFGLEGIGSTRRNALPRNATFKRVQ